MKDILPAQYNVVAYRDDNQVIGETWITKPATYALRVQFAGRRFRAQVVRLFDSSEVAVTLEE